MPLTQNKKELKTILEHISDGVLFIDSFGTIKVTNPALEKMLSIEEDLNGKKIFSLSLDNPLRQGIFRAESSFPGPYCWERNKCAGDIDCQGRDSSFCRCWLFKECGKAGSSNNTCIGCQQYKSVKVFLEKPKELEIGGKVISILSSFIEFEKKDKMWEVIVFRDVTHEKIDALVKLANAAAHELRQPLQAITSSVELLRRNNEDNNESGENLSIIKESCYRLNDIIERISHITRYKTKQYLRNIDILDIAESAVSSDKND